MMDDVKAYLFMDVCGGTYEIIEDQQSAIRDKVVITSFKNMNLHEFVFVISGITDCGLYSVGEI